TLRSVEDRVGLSELRLSSQGLEFRQASFRDFETEAFVAQIAGKGPTRSVPGRRAQDQLAERRLHGVRAPFRLPPDERERLEKEQDRFHECWVFWQPVHAVDPWLADLRDDLALLEIETGRVEKLERPTLEIDPIPSQGRGVDVCEFLWFE